MNKEQLAKRISDKLGVSSSERNLALEIFSNKVAEVLSKKEALKISDIGIFQFKGKETANSKDTLLYAPLSDELKADDESLYLKIEVTKSRRNKLDFSDDMFDIGIGKPLIPINKSTAGEQSGESSYAMLRKSIEERSEEVIADSERLENFDLVKDYLNILEPSDTELVEQEYETTDEIEEEQVEEPSEDLDSLLDETVAEEEIDIDSPVEADQVVDEVDHTDEKPTDLVDEETEQEEPAKEEEFDSEVDEEEDLNQIAIEDNSVPDEKIEKVTEEEVKDDSIPESLEEHAVENDQEENQQLDEDDLGLEDLIDDLDIEGSEEEEKDFEKQEDEIDLEDISDEINEDLAGFDIDEKPAEDIKESDEIVDGSEKTEEDEEEVDPLEADLAAIKAMAAENFVEENEVDEDEEEEVEDSIPESQEQHEELLDLDEDKLPDSFDLQEDEQGGGEEEWDWGDELKQELGSSEETKEEESDELFDQLEESLLEDEEESEEPSEEKDETKDEVEKKNVSDELEDSAPKKEKKSIINKGMDLLNKVKVGLGNLFWVVLSLFVVVTIGGFYFIFFTGDSDEKHSKTELLTEEKSEVPSETDDLNISPDKKDNVIIDPNFKEGQEVDKKNDLTEKASDTSKEKTISEQKVDEKKTTKEAADTKNDAVNKKSTTSTEKVQYRTDKNMKESGRFIFTDGNKYSVQVASFKTANRAEKEVKRLLKKNYDAYIVKAYLKTLGGTWYRIRVGGFNSLNEAKKFQRSY